MYSCKPINFAKTRREAFTLVELLVVGIIVGLIAGMLLLSAGTAADSAKAVRVISEVKTMRSVALLYKADHGDWPVWIHVEGTGYTALFSTSGLPSDYSDLITMGDGYWIGAMKGADGAAYAVAYVNDLSAGVREVLEKKSLDAGLCGEMLSGAMTSTVQEIAASPYKAEHDVLIAIISK